MIESAKRALVIINEVHENKILISDAYEKIAGILRAELESKGVAHNMYNALQVSRILSSKLFPDDVLSTPDLQKTSSGDIVVYTDDLPESYAIYRACAIFLLSVINNEEEQSSYKISAEKLLDFHDNSEHAPDDVIEYLSLIHI